MAPSIGAGPPQKQSTPEPVVSHGATWRVALAAKKGHAGGARAMTPPKHAASRTATETQNPFLHLPSQPLAANGHSHPHPANGATANGGTANGTPAPGASAQMPPLMAGVKYLTALAQLQAELASLPELSGMKKRTVPLAVPIATRSNRLVAIALKKFIYVVDLQGVGAAGLALLVPFFRSTMLVKVAYDLYNITLPNLVEPHANDILDIQLVAEVLLNLPYDCSLYDCVKAFNPGVSIAKRRDNHAQTLVGASNAITSAVVNDIADEVRWIRQAVVQVWGNDGTLKIDSLRSKSRRRLNFALKYPGSRGVLFRPKEHGVVETVSREVLVLNDSAPTDGHFKLTESCSVPALVALLPEDLMKCFGHNDRGVLIMIAEGSTSEEEEKFVDLQKLRDIVLDVGRYAYAWIGGKRHTIGSKQRLIRREDLDFVVNSVGEFGADNRAVVPDELHRISAMRAKNESITGFTLRVARTIAGGSAMLMDILLGTSASVLIVGPPCSGKTTLLRDIAREIAEQHHVIIVDTSNEIAGDGEMPDKCVGLARRMMVPNLDKQADVMIECIQNHSCEVMVIDEIGKTKEAYAARTIKNRGVRMVATAHGSLRSLVHNKDLNDLVGGSQTVTIGDEMARSRKHGPDWSVSKVAVQRAGEPTFDVVVEVSSKDLNEWAVVSDAGAAVDAILAGRQYYCQIRTRDPDGNNVRVGEAMM